MSSTTDNSEVKPTDTPTPTSSTSPPPNANSTATSTHYFVGIEGGATKTIGVLIDNNRKQLAESRSSATNLWMTGFPESAKMLETIIKELEQKVPGGVGLTAIGMSLSGAGQTESKAQLIAEMKKIGLDTDKIFVEEDILAPVFAISNRGGINMIVGTGSNCVVYNPNGTSARVGGWGHILGDEGSAYHIAHMALKILLDNSDGYCKCAYNVDVVRCALFEYLDISHLEDTLTYIYKDFSKDKIAGFALEIARLADSGDALAKDILRKAGFEIGRHIVTIRSSCDAAIVKNGELRVICTGSVFKSWKHLKPGFMEAIKPKRGSIIQQKLEQVILKKKPNQGIKDVLKIVLIKLKGHAAIGAAVWAARRKKINVTSPSNQDSNIQVIDTILLTGEV